MSGRRRISNPLNPSVRILVKLAEITVDKMPKLADPEMLAWIDAMRREGYIEKKRKQP